jgi:hypothetical protein
MLRKIHFYLGVFFSPLILFFSISGIWQVLDIKHPLLNKLSTLHWNSALESGFSFSNSWVEVLVIVMAFGLILSTVFGLIISFKYSQRKKTTIISFVLGLVIPVILAIMAALSS